MKPGAAQVPIRRLSGAETVDVIDQVVVEEPLEIRLGDEPVAVVMRTPGDDMALAVGFLFSEGILSEPDQVLSVAYCQDTTEDAAGNVVRVLASGANLDAAEAARRTTYASSSCGLCGKTTLDSVRLMAPPAGPQLCLESRIVQQVMTRLSEHQSLFEATGGLHAAGLFEANGDLVLVREDVGRHNACDKVLGTLAMQERWPLHETILALSGRASFEMVQKAAMAGIAAVVAVSAPSSLAVEFAREHPMTLIGFARPTGMNIYSGQVNS